MKFEFASVASQIEADWPVTVPVPQDGGKVTEQTFAVRFRLIDDEGIAGLGEGIESQKEALRSAIVGLGKDEEQDFTPLLVEQLIGTTYVRLALLGAYTAFAMGVAVKNSGKRPG